MINTGTLKSHINDSEVAWQLVEAIPYDPSCYQHDEGYIVAVRTRIDGDRNNYYFISTMTGNVYDQEDKQEEDETDSLTRLREDLYCPEVQAMLNNFTDMMLHQWCGDQEA